MASKDLEMSNRGTASKRKCVTLLIKKKLEIMRRPESGGHGFI
jgi:hypothetical protein